MSKRILKLTEQELHNMIQECVGSILSEMDGKTYARIHNFSQKAKDDIQRGVFQYPKTTAKKYRKDGKPRKHPFTRTTMIDNDDAISRATNLQSSAQQHWLKDFVGKTFKFFAKDRLQLTAHILFTFEKITKIDLKKTILVGTVVFNNRQINGDGIIVDFTTGKVKYHERGSRYLYSLEIDNRFKPLWDGLLEQIKMALDNMQ